jgi:HD-GYP domain-containing protein (c-di-GMP phosphodiesterase class II)
MAVANLYAKLTIRRIDREKMSREGACEWLQKESGHMLDPEMTGLFIRALEEKEKNGGEDHD